MVFELQWNYDSFQMHEKKDCSVKIGKFIFHSTNL